MNFGEKIRELRKAKNLTLRELAVKVKVNFTYLSKIENQKSMKITEAERKLDQKGHNSKKRAKIEATLSVELQKLDENMNKVMTKNEERVAKKTEKSEGKLEKVDKREHKIAQKIYWIVIDKVERFENDAVPEDDEEAG